MVRAAGILAALTLLGASAGTARAATPFGYLPTPTDQLGVPGAPAGTEITPSGTLYTGAAELGFRYGPRLRTWNVPTRTLRDGWLPVLDSQSDSGGVRYALTVWASRVAGRAVDFASVRMTNRSTRTRTARWGTFASWSGGARLATGAYAFRFPRPVAVDNDHSPTQPGEPFDPRAVWGFSGRVATRSGEAIYLFPPGARTAARLSPGALAPGSRAGAATYTARLAPGTSRRLVFRMPVTSLPAGAATTRAIAAADPDRALAGTVRGWRAALAGAARISVPEAKVGDTYRTSLVNILEARSPRAGGIAQTVNLLNYHGFWLRDAAMIDESLLLAGLPHLVRENLRYAARFQQPDGLFNSQAEQFDGFGEALWAYAEYVRRTGDRAFARSILPAVERAMGWLAAERRSDPLGLMPLSHTYDNEQTTGHLAGDDFWAYAGARGAASVAALAGHSALAGRYASAAASFRTVVARAVARAAPRYGGAIPPALDRAGGFDWGNLWGAWPTGTLAATDPAVGRTLTHERRHFREGIATYGRLLHGYIGYRVFETELLRGEQDRVVRGVYAELAHTTATNGGFEFASHFGAPGARDNLTPHGWWAAEYVLLLRNMLVREAGGAVRLGSALSPAWLGTGKTIALTGAPTLAGRVSFTLRGTATGAVLAWNAALRPGTPLSFAIPASVDRVSAAGLNRRHTAVRLHLGRGRLVLRWRRRGPASESFAGAVARLPRG